MQYVVGSSPYSVTTGDFNNDTKLDLAVTILDDKSVSVLLGNGDGTFQSKIKYVVGASPVSVALGDFDGNKKLDLVVAKKMERFISIRTMQLAVIQPS
jgi:hypothetical protein